MKEHPDKPRGNSQNENSPCRRADGSRDHTPAASWHELDALLERQLRRPICGPDLTRSIMGRLGYMRVPPQVARRHRVRLWMARSLVCLMALAAIGMGLQLRNTSPDARVPSQVTLPSAITNDLEHHQRRVHDTWRLLQDMRPSFDRADWSGPTRAPDAASEACPAELSRPGAMEDGSDAEFETPLFDEDVNRSAIAPVQWI